MADTGLVKFRSLTKNSAVSQSKKILNKLEKESSARYLYLYFKSGVLGTTGYLFVDVDPQKVSPDLRKSMIFFDQFAIKVILYSSIAHQTDISGKWTHRNTFTFPSGEKAFEYVERWKLLTSEFPMKKWASDPKLSDMAKPKYYTFSCEYTVQFINKKGDVEETVFEESIINDYRICN